MAKALDVNDDTAQHQERQAQHQVQPDERRQPADDKKANLARQDKLDGKSFQVNENSVEEGESVTPDLPPKA